MYIVIAIAVAVLGTLSPSVRSWVGGPVYWACVVVALLTLYGATL